MASGSAQTDPLAGVRSPRRGPTTAVLACSLLPLLTSGWGCSTRTRPEPVPEVPPLQLEVSHFSGSALAGAIADMDLVDPSTDEAILVRCQILYLDDLPTALDPIGARVGLVIGIRESKPVLPTAALLAGARVGSGAEAEAFASELFGDSTSRTVVPIETLQGIAPVGASLVFSAQVEQGRRGTSATGTEISLLISREPETPDDLRAVLVVEDTYSEPERRSQEQRRLLSLTDAPTIDGAPLVVIVPTPIASRSTRGFAAVVRAVRLSPDNPEFEGLLGSCEQNLRSAQDTARLESDAGANIPSDRLLRRQALERFREDGAKARADLLFALAGLESPLARDLALSAEDPLLDRYAERMRALEGPLDEEWPLERSAFELLAELGARGESAPELDAILLDHAGQLGRRPGVLRRVVESASDRIALERALISENRRLLRDDDPATRVRAHDWLRHRNVVVPDFDPLGTPEERRHALRAAEKEANR